MEPAIDSSSLSSLLDRHTPPEDQLKAIGHQRRHGEGPIAPQKKNKVLENPRSGKSETGIENFRENRTM